MALPVRGSWTWWPGTSRGTVCFVEVKLRRERGTLPREAVDARKQARLRSAAALYLSQHELDAPARFDVAEVYTDENHRIIRLEPTWRTFFKRRR